MFGGKKHISKILTNIKSFTDVQKSLQELEKKVNELLSSVNVGAESEVSDKDGKSGDTRITRNPDTTYTFEIRTEEGWKTPAMGESLITFKDKPAQVAKHQKVAISDIETDDASTGASNASKNIFDASTGEFSIDHLTKNQTGGLMKPDYDSGWLRMIRNDVRVHQDPPMQIVHNLNVFPTVFHFYFAPGQGSGSQGDAVDESEITWFTELETSSMGDGYNKGSTVYVSKTEARMHCADDHTYVGSDFVVSAADHRTTYQDGTVRFIAWK